ncbi:MAG: AtpZ/AtpI family protein [Acidimicrobiia bacterium]|nr:AtpZ/AtpI family protein [Acidimicrobiia bacterium]
MKLLKKNTRVSTTDSLGHGMDAVIVIGLFLAGGYGLDRLFGTTPLFMIIMTIVGAVGLFTSFRYRYEARMQEHEAQRAARIEAARPSPTKSPTTSSEVI